jgi:sortase (surface protein transpeptidase)
MPTRLCLLLAALLLAACGGPLFSQPAQPLATLPTAAIAARPPQPTPAPRPNPTANPAVIDRPILDDLRATAIAAAPPSPTALPEPTPAARAASAPARIVIGAIQLDRPLMPVGLDAQAAPIVPKYDAAWFTGSATPGQGDNVVLWGHALRFRDSPDVPAPFGRLHELQPGAGIALFDERGGQHDYTVTRQIWATPDQVDYILPKGRELLTLVSCIGQQVLADDGTVLTMSHRLITIAEPAQILSASR